MLRTRLQLIIISAEARFNWGELHVKKRQEIAEVPKRQLTRKGVISCAVVGWFVPERRNVAQRQTGRLPELPAATAGSADVVEGDGAAAEEDEGEGEGGESEGELVSAVAH